MVKLSILIPTINRADLLGDSLKTLAEQKEYFEELLIIDNGNQTIIGPSILYDKIRVLTSNHNLGVSGSWNLGITELFKNSEITHVLALNDDVSLGTTQLKEIAETINSNLDRWFLVGPYYWSVYAISRDGAKNMQYEPNKYFDEHFFPAYFEDNDFHWRMRQIDESKYLGNVSSFTPEKYINSGSLQKDPTLNRTFEQNRRYYISKWGGAPSWEVYKKPFNL